MRHLCPHPRVNTTQFCVIERFHFLARNTLYIGGGNTRGATHQDLPYPSSVKLQVWLQSWRPLTWYKPSAP